MEGKEGNPWEMVPGKPLQKLSPQGETDLLVLTALRGQELLVFVSPSCFQY